MNPIESLIRGFQELVAQVPELVQPFVVMLAGAIPFIEGEGAAVIGVIGGINPVIAGIAAAGANFLAVLGVVTVGSRARAAVVNRRAARARSPRPGTATRNAAVAGGVAVDTEIALETELAETELAKPESKGRQRFKRWLVRFGVPGASLLGPLAIPTHFTSAMLVASGTPRGWVLLWQAIAIALWTTVGTVISWIGVTVVLGA